MKIPCKDIALNLEQQLKLETETLRKQNIYPKLVTILVGSEPEQISFVHIKRKTAERIGVRFELVHLETEPPFEEFMEIVREKATNPATSGIIIQQPFPESFNHEKIYQLIPPHKEIEGHRPDSSFHFPLSLAVLNGIKYIIAEQNNIQQPSQVIVNFEDDKHTFYEFLHDKKIVIAGRGATGGAPIAKAFDDIGISYVVTHSNTHQPDDLYMKADIIITATGKKIINTENIREGVILLNVGLRKEDGKLKGDYDEKAIADTAAYYTQTPGGLGPLDVLYLFKNVLEAAKSSY